MDHHTFFIVVVILFAYAFDFINGFHDAANSIATIVTTGVLTPRQAVIWAAFFNFIAFLFFSLMVAKTIGSDLIDSNHINPVLILSALIGAIFWNLLSWYFGLPTSSSHALIGGLAGAAIVQSGFAVLKPAGFIKVAIGIFVSPVLGLLIGLLLTFLLKYFLRNNNQQKLHLTFKSFQLVSSALLSLTHGGNDAQKTMGIIAVLLFSSSWLSGEFYIPFWVVVSCQLVISLGTLFGGLRIVRTMGTKITKLDTFNGCTAETTAAAIIFACTEFGVPVSTTQTVTGAIAGAGLVNGLHGTHWPTIRIIYFTWMLTIPASALVAAICLKLIGCLL